jgi:ribosomal protein S27AE
MADNDGMVCPRCRVEMNHHGDKLVYTTESQDAGQTDHSPGGIIQEFYTCPKCGGSASRQA